MMKVKLVTSLVIIIGIVFELWLFFDSNKVESEINNSQQVDIQAVTVSKATKEKWETYLTAKGPIEPWQLSKVTAEISDLPIKDIYVELGDYVEKGEILARFNSERIEIELSELQTNWEKELANKKRAIQLEHSGAISDLDIEDYINRERIANAQMKLKQWYLDKTVIRAPVSGIIASQTAVLGQVGNVGDELFSLIRDRRLEWRGLITAEQERYISVGQEVDLLLPSGNAALGVVRNIDPTFNPATRLAQIYVDIDNNESIKPGMYIQGRISINSRTSTTINSKSVVFLSGKNYIFCVKEDKNEYFAIRKLVKIGESKGGRSEIISGIDPGDIVVQRGAGFLSDGERILVIE